MALKLSIFTTITNPIQRGDNFRDALECYNELADEVVEVIGGCPVEAHGNFMEPKDEKNIGFNYLWPKEFSWEFIGQQFQRGYEICTGDVVIHADLDFIWHERDFSTIRVTAQKMLDSNIPAMSMYKYQFVLPDRYNIKSRLVTMVNKRDYKGRIKFDSGKDLCMPSLDGVHIGLDDVPESGIPFYNYEKILKNSEQIANDQGRMERAWFRKFGFYQMGSDGTDLSAYKKWIEVQKNKLLKPHKHIQISEHPKFVQDTILNLNPDNFGYNGLRELELNDYAKNL